MSVLSSKLTDDWMSVADGKSTYMARFRVVTSSRTEPAPTMLLNATAASPDPVPAYMASYSLNGASDPNAFAKNYSPKRVKSDDGACHWDVEVTWSGLEGKDADDDWTPDQDPLTRPLRIDVDEEEVQEIVENGWNEEELPNIPRPADTYGPIVTAANGPPGTPYIRARRVPVLVVIKNFATLAEIVALQNEFIDKISDGVFYGAPAKKALVRNIKPSSLMYAGGTSYREAEFRIAMYDKGWSYPMVNRGFEYFKESVITPGTFVRMPVTKPDGTLAAEPALLELDGTKTPEGQLGTVINWRVNDTADFSGMGIGTS